jgi:transposase-like protein
MGSTRSKRPSPTYTPEQEAVLSALQFVADNPELDPTMIRALKLMCDGSKINYNHIAEECGVTTQTLWRWRQLPAFRAALTRVKRSILGDVAIKLVLAVSDSVDALETLRDDAEAPANVRLGAAKAIIDYAFTHVEQAAIAADNEVIMEQIKNGGS